MSVFTDKITLFYRLNSTLFTFLYQINDNGYVPRYTISQFISDFKDWNCGKYHKKEWVPTTMTYIRGVNLYTRLRYGDVCVGSGVKVFKVGKVKPGIWHTLVLGVSWQSRSNGYFKMWFDGGIYIVLSCAVSQ